MPPKPTTQKGNRRVSIDPALVSTSKTTNKKKTKSRPTDKPSRRIGPKGSDIEEEQGDDEDDALDGSLDANSSVEVRRMLNEKLSKRNKKQSAKFMELEVTVRELFREAREASEERKMVCNAMLENVFLGFERMPQTGVEPDTIQTVHLLGVQSKLVTKVATTHETVIASILEEAKAAAKQVDENLADHELLRERSRKRLMKYAAKEFKRGLDAQKFATDANAYIRHYRKLIML